ncbi:pyridoxal phosphate-dependent transferase [Plectosphaerella plurivora]|uniref:Pyridoxal phosphate-dependent transferase n=1 Tax=Plectosphaerella plurivora TaxID=936078 RepID=A0A9P8V0C1_9PEZI|nr:pyridoxal phosphate-dependent transferase [Plectosphaerella plurivora]
MDSNQFKEAAKASIDDIAAYYDTIEDRKVLPDVQPGYLRALLPSTAPEDPEPWSAIHSDVTSKILPGITHWQSPNFMAFFPCSGSYPAMVAELYSNAFNGAHFNWICSPAVTELETIVLDWLAKLLALPECFLSSTRGGGVIHGTASEAILTVMVAARDRFVQDALAARFPEGSAATEEEKEDELWRIRSRLVALGSAASHSSTKKAAQILGVRFLAVPVSRDDGYSMTGNGLAATLADCRAKGLHPFYLTATLGTTDTCAVDDFPGIVNALDAHSSSQPSRVWVHVDAAYAGSALILPKHQHLTTPFTNFDSFNINPHKWLLTTFDCSALWVRDRAWLVDSSLSVKPPYLRNQHSDGGLVTDYRDWQIPLGRRFRSLKLWFVLRSHGASGLREHIDKGIKLCEHLGTLLETRKDLFEIITGPRFALVVFRVIATKTKDLPEAEAEKERNEVTEALCDRVNEEGQVYITPTVLNGLHAIRVCTGVSARMEERHVQRAFDILVKGAEELLAQA